MRRENIKVQLSDGEMSAYLIDGTIKALDALDISDAERMRIYSGNAIDLLRLA